MANLLASFWSLMGRWLEARHLAALAGDCYRLAGNKGGKRGAMALRRLGKLLSDSGQLQSALTAYQEAVQADPTNAAVWCDLGSTHRHFCQFAEARQCYDRALAIDPHSSLALTGKGKLHLAEGNAVAALDDFDRVLKWAPGFYEALLSRVAALIECDNLDEAEVAAKQAIEQYPESAACHVNLGVVLERTGDTRRALRAYQAALELDPDNQEASFNQAILDDDGRLLKNSVEFIRRRIELKGESAYLLGLLTMALFSGGELVEAEVVSRRLVENYPTHAHGWKILADCAHERGDASAAFEYFSKALEIRSEWAEVFSSFAVNATYLRDQTPESIFRIHRDWAELYETPLLTKQFVHPLGNSEKMRLKIGYMSGDFHNHPVGILLRGALQQHDHNRFEIHCFDARSNDAPDHTAEILRANSDVWHEVQSLSTVQLAELIHNQNIDILVDLSGHTVYNRLQVFPLKPAPIQATWIGYFHSTGLSSIDYFISDPFTSPDPADQFFSETLVRLPHSRFCYTPFDFAPEVAEAPSTRTGHITFGSFNRMAKVTEQVIDTWSAILLQLPDARLLIKAKGLSDEENVVHLRKRFEARGLSAERLILRPASGYFQMFEEYADIDVALDPFPFNGGMTTLDALWMGVPVIALAGISVVARQSIAVLSNLGLEELVFADVDAYVAGAVALANNRARLIELRRSIRPRMSRSPLCDAEQFTADLEMLYRRMWLAWCRGEKLGPEIVPGAPVARKIAGNTGCNRRDSGHLLELFQKKWAVNPSEDAPKPRPTPKVVAQETIELISATRLSESDFWNKSALGISLRRCALVNRIVPHIAFENKRGLPEVFNERIDSPTSHEILVFIHDDVWIDDYFFSSNVIDGLNSFDVVGVAGNRRRSPNQPAWLFIDNEFTWDTNYLSGRIAHDLHPFGAVSVYGDVPAECELLDGVFLAARKSKLRASKVQFDPCFDFHFYDMDFCRSATTNGLRLGTWPICITHQSKGAFGGLKWKEKYRLYLEKWQS